MRWNRAVLLSATVAIGLVIGGVALGRQLGAPEAREQIAALVGAVSPDEVRIKSIAPGMIGHDAIGEAEVGLAFRLTEASDGWHVTSVRLGAGQWEDVDMLARGLRH